MSTIAALPGMHERSEDGPVFSAAENARDYGEFWLAYLNAHSRFGTKLVHAIATLFGLFCAFPAFGVTTNLWWPIIGLVGGYAMAWTSHALFEGNTPTTFSNPYWSYLADFEMAYFVLTGGIRSEMNRIMLDGARVGHKRTLARRLGNVAWWSYFVLMAGLVNAHAVSFIPLGFH